jgi:ribosome-associated protein
VREVLRLPRSVPFVVFRDSNHQRGEELLRIYSEVPDFLNVRSGVAIPLSEIELRTSRSSGPGGQHANVTASRVEAVFDVHASTALSEAQKARVAARLGPRVTAAAQDTRSQLRNRELALERLAQRLGHALQVHRARTATRPTAASKRRRLDAKKRRGETKRARRRPADDG